MNHYQRNKYKTMKKKRKKKRSNESENEKMVRLAEVR